MARPSKNITDRRVRRLEIRLTEAEEQAIVLQASNGGLTVSDHLRKVALGCAPRVQKANPERAAFIKGLAELGKVGSNVNQIAKTLNTDLAVGQRLTVSGDLVSATLYAIQTLSANLLKHLTDGHQR